MTLYREAAFYLSGRSGISSATAVLFRQCREAYEGLDVSGKTVLDIGADWGTSPLYFYARGARLIIAYEADPKKREGLRRLADVGIPIEVKDRWEGLYPQADVLKIDCEGCEAGFDLSKLSLYPKWAFALHERLFGLRSKLQDRGAVLSHKQEGEEVWVKA